MMKWIPCSKRLPKDENEQVIVTFQNGQIEICSYSEVLGWIVNRMSAVFTTDSVIAWMPFPDPYIATIPIVNIYTYQTIRGPNIKKGAYAYILESEIKGKTGTAKDIGIIEPMSANKAELTTLLKALKRLCSECDLHIFTESMYIITGIEINLDKWEQNGWKTSKGEEIANISEWQQINEYRKKHKMSVAYCGKTKECINTVSHEYQEWMKWETNKKLKENTDDKNK